MTGRELTKYDILNPDGALVALDNIHVGGRFRKDYGDMSALIADVAANGIITPITVARLTEEEKAALKTDKEFTLLAGGRRVNAARANHMPAVLAHIYPEGLDRKRKLLIELAENEQRMAMSWTEKAELVEQIHSGMVEVFGAKAKTPGKPDAIGWSARDTAKLMNLSAGGVSENLKLAKAIKAVPTLKTCTTASEAKQALKQAVRDTKAEDSAKQFEDGVLDVEPMKEILIKSYVEGNFFERIKKVPNEILDFVHMDSPYAIGLDKGRKKDKMIFTEEYVEWDREHYPELIRTSIEECYRVLKPNGWMFIWFALEWQGHLTEVCESLGLVVPKAPLLWVKPNGQTNQPELYLANAYETCLYARKGNAKIFRPGRVNHFDYGLTSSTVSMHPTHKPVELVQDILSTFLPPESRGISPFLGSGCDILASCNAGMICFGYDLSRVFKGKFIELVQRQRYGEYTAYPNKKKVQEQEEIPQPDLPIEIVQ